MTSEGGLGLSIVVPAHDEVDGIDAAVEEALAALDRLAATVGRGEVIVTDDGSTDGTAERLAVLAAADGRVRVVTHPTCRGLGAAIRSGLGAAVGDVVLYIDADQPFDLTEIPRLLAPLDRGADVVAGYRLGERSEGLRRWVYTRTYNAVVRVVLGLRVRDVNFAAKVLRRPVVDALDLRSEGSFIDAEILARATRLGFALAEVGLEYHPRTRGTSTLSSQATIATILREMRALGPEIRRLRPVPETVVGRP